jgi:hypothetical protein
MSHFVGRSLDHLKRSTFHSYGVLKARAGHCYKYSTPNGVKNKSSRAKKICTTQLVDSYIDQICVNCNFSQIQCKIKVLNSRFLVAHGGEMLQQQAMNEDVAAADFLEEDEAGGIIEEVSITARGMAFKIKNEAKYRMHDKIHPTVPQTGG